MILVMSVSFLFTACSSDDKGSDSETNGGTEGGVNVKSYGTFTVHTKVDDVDKKLVYWNYLPVTGYDKVNGTIKGVHMEMWDVNYGDTKENYDKIDEERTKVYGELKGGSLLIALNNVEEGLYTITNRFGHFPKDVKDGGRRLAIISVNLGIENEKR